MSCTMTENTTVNEQPRRKDSSGTGVASRAGGGKYHHDPYHHPGLAQQYLTPSESHPQSRIRAERSELPTITTTIGGRTSYDGQHHGQEYPPVDSSYAPVYGDQDNDYWHNCIEGGPDCDESCSSWGRSCVAIPRTLKDRQSRMAMFACLAPSAEDFANAGYGSSSHLYQQGDDEEPTECAGPSTCLGWPPEHQYYSNAHYNPHHPPPPEYSEENTPIATPRHHPSASGSEFDVGSASVVSTTGALRKELEGKCHFLAFPEPEIVKKVVADVKATKPPPSNTPGANLPVFFGQVLFSTTPDQLSWLVYDLAKVMPSIVTNHSPGCFTCYFSSMEECATVLVLNKRVLFDQGGCWVARTESEQLCINQVTSNTQRKRRDPATSKLPRGAMVVEMGATAGGAGSRGGNHAGASRPAPSYHAQPYYNQMPNGYGYHRPAYPPPVHQGPYHRQNVARPTAPAGSRMN